MKFITAVLQAIGSGFRNYFNFGGYATRMEFWSWMVFQFLCFVILLVFGQAAGYGSIDDFWVRSFGPDSSGAAGFELFIVATLIPTLSLISRRLRASGRNPLYLGMWYLIVLISGFIFWGFDAETREFPAQLLLAPFWVNFNSIAYPISGVTNLLVYMFDDAEHWPWAAQGVINTFFVVWMLIWVWKDSPQFAKVNNPEGDASSNEAPLAESHVSQPSLDQSSISATCTNCGETSPRGATHCISCGNTLPLLICPKCQTENIPQAKFCMGCGEER